MKNTQKKLKAKHFRYLSRDVIKNPMTYLREFYGSQTTLSEWLNQINLMINLAAFPDIARSAHAENGYECKRLIEQIEIAYVLFRQCNLNKQKHPLHLFPTRSDHYNYIIDSRYTKDDQVNPADAISIFFSFQPLKEWYNTMDDIWMYISPPRSTDYNKFGDKIVAIKELLFRLADALHNIYQQEGLHISLPTYVISEPGPIRCAHENINDNTDNSPK